MFDSIMVPVDLHMDPMVSKAMDVAGDLAKLYDAKITLVSVTGSVVTEAPHTPEKARAALSAIATSLETKTGISVAAHNITSPDVPAEVDSALMRAVDNVGADLVVVGSHVPGLVEYMFSSHAGKLASHSKVSVFVVR